MRYIPSAAKSPLVFEAQFGSFKALFGDLSAEKIIWALGCLLCLSQSSVGITIAHLARTLNQGMQWSEVCRCVVWMTTTQCIVIQFDKPKKPSYLWKENQLARRLRHWLMTGKFAFLSAIRSKHKWFDQLIVCRTELWFVNPESSFGELMLFSIFNAWQPRIIMCQTLS